VQDLFEAGPPGPAEICGCTCGAYSHGSLSRRRNAVMTRAAHLFRFAHTVPEGAVSLRSARERLTVGLPYLAVTRGWHDRPVRRRPVVLAVSLLLIVGCGGGNGSDVAQVATFPWPEGPGPVVAAETPVPGIYVPLDRIEGAIPKALPKNVTQRCRIGAIVEITLKNGQVFRYGPCDRPASIERLRLTLIRAAQHERPAGVSARPVTPREWKSGIRDSYDGKIDHPHRCAAVHEAIERIPHDTIYFGAPGSASGALLAFEKKACEG